VCAVAAGGACSVGVSAPAFFAGDDGKVGEGGTGQEDGGG